ADPNCVVLSRDGRVHRPGQTIPVRITKQFRFDDAANSVEILYKLSCPHGTSVEATFAVENNFTFQAGHAHDRYLLIDNQRPESSWLDTSTRHPRAFGIAMVDEYRNLAAAVVSDREAEIWHLPIFTVSLSEAGFERVYQGTTLVHVYRITLSDNPARVALTVHAGRMAEVLREAFAASSVSAR
ncbi:hypothetical protein C3F09_09790, partial [candidate division GN15 bacterium]